MSANLRGELMPDGRMEFEHGVQSHPDFIDVSEAVYGEITTDSRRMDRLWADWLSAGMPGVAERLRDELRGTEALSFQSVTAERFNKRMGEIVRQQFDLRVCQVADDEAGELLSSPALMAKWRDAQAEAQWEERSGALVGAA